MTIRHCIAAFAARRGVVAIQRMGRVLNEQAAVMLTHRDTFYYQRLELAFAVAQLQAAFWLSIAEQCQGRAREAQP